MHILFWYHHLIWAVVVAQLVGRSLPIPKVRSSNPVIGKNLYIYWKFVYCQLCIEKTKKRKKRPGMAHFKKHWLLSTALVYEPKYDIRLRNYLFSRLQHHLMLQIGTTKSFLQDSVSLVHSDLACNWENTEIKVNNSFLFFSLLTYLHFLRKIFNFRENILKMKPLLPPPAAAASG